MNFNQWKLLNYLKDSLAKISTDKQLQTKDITQLVNKLPSSAEILKFLETTGIKATKDNIGLAKAYLPGIFSNFSKKVKKIEGSSGVHSWKDKTSNKVLVCTEEQILNAIESATTDEEKIMAIENFIGHLKMHPDARNRAIKMGAIRKLLFVRYQIVNENCRLEQPLREALTLVGYTDPVPTRGVRILSIDGGGIRGILVLEMLKKLEELTGQKVHELFDFFCGVSTGAILSFAMGIHHVSLEEISREYGRISNEVFKQSRIWGTGSLVWSHAYYNTTLWESKLQEYLGRECLISTSRDPQCPKLCAISAVVNQAQVSAFVFRNYTLPWRFQSQYHGTWDCEVWQAARASAAAPTYFEEYTLGKYVHQDGGILVNNPTALAIHEAKQLWPNTPIQCVVSFGTGRTVQPPPFSMFPQEKEVISKSTSWSDKFFKILDSATDTEGVHTMLSDLLPPHVYYRFNPYLTEMVDMVETDPEKLAQLRRDALMYLRRNEDKFHEAAKYLTQKKTFSQKIGDFVNVQRDILDV